MSKETIPPFEVRPPAELNVQDSTIHLRLFNGNDVQNLLELAQESAVQQYVPWAKRVHDSESAATTIQHFESAWDRKIMARYAVEKDGAFVGYAGVWSDKVPGYYEVGFAMLPQFRGQGIGTRTLSELFSMAKDDLQAVGMVGYVNDTNEASKAVVTRLGLLPTDEFDDDDRRYELRF